MGKLTGKRLLLIGFIVVLLVAIPLTLYVLKQRSTNQSHAQVSTTLSFSPSSTKSAPINANVNDSVPLQITVDPGKNLVSFVKVIIQYDPAKLQTAGASAFVPNSAAFPTILDGPVYSAGQISVTLSIGADPTKAIQSPVTAGTITFTAIAPTDPGQPTEVSYITTTATDTQVLSTGSSDQASENVLSTTNPAYIAIAGNATTPTDTPTITLTPTVTPTLVPGAPTYTPAPTDTPTPTPTPTPTGTPSAEVIPAPTNTPVPIVMAIPTATPVPPTATIAATGSTDITFGAGAILTTVAVVGAIIFFVI